jgi:hypothetical protein
MEINTVLAKENTVLTKENTVLMKENTVLCCSDKRINTVINDGKHSTGDEGKHNTDGGKHSTDKGKHSRGKRYSTPQPWSIYVYMYIILAPPAVYTSARQLIWRVSVGQC